MEEAAKKAWRAGLVSKARQLAPERSREIAASAEKAAERASQHVDELARGSESSRRQLQGACLAFGGFKALNDSLLPAEEALNAVEALQGKGASQLVRGVTKLSLALSPSPERISGRALASLKEDLGDAFSPSLSQGILTLGQCPVSELFSREGLDEGLARRLTSSTCCQALVARLPPELGLDCVSSIAQGQGQCCIVSTAPRPFASRRSS